jgi:hypothetical protein
MDRNELADQLQAIFDPEPDEDGFVPDTPPHPRLADSHGLNLSYWKPFEFGSTSQFSRLVRDRADPVNAVTQSLSVPSSLFWAGLRLFGDSLLAYCDTEDRRGVFRYYPPILVTFWAGFEAFVRLYSELLIHLLPATPVAVKSALLEVEDYVERDGGICQRQRSRPVLDRYWLLLKYGWKLEFDRGGRIWQAGQDVAAVRNQIVHYEVSTAPTLKATELWNYLESMLLLLIGPSAALRRSVFHRQFDLYWVLVDLNRLIEEFEERPVHKGWPFSPYLFSCSFEGIDSTRYPPGFTSH